MLGKNWDLQAPLSELDELPPEPGLTPLASAVLYGRGVREQAEVKKILHPDSLPLFDPFLLSDMKEAVDILRKALRAHKKMLVYGDYDCDGVTATYMVWSYLRHRGADCRYSVPERSASTYGITTEMVDAILEEGISLLITVDSGITAKEEIAYAVSQGMTVIITDHHECPLSQTDGTPELPPAAAIIDPLRPGDMYPYKHLAGVGVAFKLISALDGNPDAIFNRYGDILTLGTLADVMPLTGENRRIVSQGLPRLQKTKNKGIQALMEAAGVNPRRLVASNVNYTLTPRINAAGRLASADIAVEMLATRDPLRAREIAHILCGINTRRQENENALYQEIEELLISRNFFPTRDKAIVLWGEGWCGGICGIVCSRLMCTYGVPVILITVEGDICKGSGRSLPGFNLYDALASLSDCLEKYGGHAQAAGLTIRRERLEEFRTRFMALTEEAFTAREIRPTLSIDAEVRARSLTEENVEGLSLLEPFGNRWALPVFCMFGVRIVSILPSPNRRHLTLKLEKCMVMLEAMLFRVSPEEFTLDEGDLCDIAFIPELSVYRGERRMQLMVQDIRPCATCGEEGCALYARFLQGEKLTCCERGAMRPQKEDFATLWRYLTQKMEGHPFRTGIIELQHELRHRYRRDIPPAKLCVVLQALSEAGLVSFELFPDGKVRIISVATSSTPIHPEETETMQRLK